MDTKIYKRLEQIGLILKMPTKQRISLLEKYLEQNHTSAFELAKTASLANGRIKNAEASLVEVYEAWLNRYDRAWIIAIQMKPFLDRTEEEIWEIAAQETEYSISSCRQAIQALRKSR